MGCSGSDLDLCAVGSKKVIVWDLYLKLQTAAPGISGQSGKNWDAYNAKVGGDTYQLLRDHGSMFGGSQYFIKKFGPTGNLIAQVKAGRCLLGGNVNFAYFNFNDPLARTLAGRLGIDKPSN